MKLDLLKTATFAVEGVVISTCALAATQIATAHGGSIWACAPILTIAAMESLRVPVAMTMPKLKLLGQVAATALLIGITPLTFEGTALAFEQFMHQRVVEVAKAQTTADKAQTALNGANDETARRTADLERLEQVAKDAEAHRVEIAKKQPQLQALPPTQQCPSYRWVGKGKRAHQIVTGSHPCPDNGVTKSITNGNREAQEHHDSDLAKAEDEVGKARGDLRAAEAAPAPDTKKLAADLQDAKSDLELAKADSVMHRAAAAWFGVDVGDLSTAQFEIFKKWAMFGLAAATATVTMITAFVANMSRRDGRPSKVGMAWRAYLARKRKKLVRVVEKIKNAPPLKVLEIKYVPFDPVSGRVINSDGSTGEFANKGSAT
jgi:hypothetical protein